MMPGNFTWFISLPDSRSSYLIFFMPSMSSLLFSRLLAWGRIDWIMDRLMFEYFFSSWRRLSTSRSCLDLFFVADLQLIPEKLVLMKLFLVVQLRPVCPTISNQSYFHWVERGNTRELWALCSWTWSCAKDTNDAKRYVPLYFLGSLTIKLISTLKSTNLH